MNTYAIANAIEKFADNFKKTIDEKNKIEKEKLTFEKEKFEFTKKQKECKYEEQCEHDWNMTGTSIDSLNIIHHYTCSKCGKRKSLSLGI